MNQQATSDRMRTTPDDPNYAPFLRAVTETFAERVNTARAAFTVDTSELWDVYLGAFPDAERQTYNCSACRHFVQRFGGIVLVEPDGARVSACWEPSAIPVGFGNIAERMREAVTRRPIIAQVVAAAGVLGTPQTGPWFHLATAWPDRLAHRDRLRTPSQVAAATRENVLTVERALDEFSADALREAQRVLDADALSRAEKFIGPVRWLLDLHARRAETKDERKRNAIVWQAVATSPEGYSHPRASVIGPLLEGIAAGKAFETLRADFAAMLHPLRYQRPTSAPSRGNIAEAERIVAELGLARSLERRFARLDECQTLWAPAPTRERDATTGGVFAHLAPKDASAATPSLVLPPQTMTWGKFARTVLPTTQAMEFYVPAHGNFSGLVTATHADAPPIIRWDRDDARNPVTSYVYHNGSSAARWNLRAGEWRTVTAIVPRPNLWGAHPQPQHGTGLLIVLRGAVDADVTELALFPETVRDDLHAIRSTIEAFSKAGSITGAAEASACGYNIGKEHCGVQLRVTVEGRATEYRIDRWD